MKEFSDIVVDQLTVQNIAIPKFAKMIGLSTSHVYNLLSGRDGKRWNADTIDKACKVLKITVEFKI